MGRPVALGFALGALALLGARFGQRPPKVGALPQVVANAIRRHADPEDFEAFAEAVGKHVAAGRPLTRAALSMLAAIYFDPEAVDAIKRDLKAQGI
jgi:hypothetical protein